jgi:hypothetical protein
MADRKSEPQSYGSQNDWLTGETGQDVNRLKGNPNSQRSDFYVNAPSQAEDFERDRPARAEENDDEEPALKVNSNPGAAKRDSYFKKRDHY